MPLSRDTWQEIDKMPFNPITQTGYIPSTTPKITSTTDSFTQAAKTITLTVPRHCRILGFIATAAVTSQDAAVHGYFGYLYLNDRLILSQTFSYDPSIGGSGTVFYENGQSFIALELYQNDVFTLTLNPQATTCTGNITITLIYQEI